MYHVDNAKIIGKHHITGNLVQLPPEVTVLYFVISSRKSPTLGQFRLSFKLFNETKPDKYLWNYTVGAAAISQAVIMVCVSKVGTEWNVYEIGKLSAGNVLLYINNYV
ncbi:10183_t:CDS:2 [Cetraspora pellucida]|uniref:10183_t:CDS:1 n=1 Tax=Cetraspora pellucida TaxID=1433469 RepID=A0ACA9K752_9GLOM|nr:10183_t:CDS:2 [Cetraspora pellucida]